MCRTELQAGFILRRGYVLQKGVQIEIEQIEHNLPIQNSEVRGLQPYPI